MPANGQKAASQSISNIFGNGLNQKLNALNTPRESTTAEASKPASANTPAPAKASAAPNASTNTVFTGLCAALNKYEQDMVGKTIEIANKYTVKFVPESLASSTIALPGGIDKALTPMQNGDSAKDKVDSGTNKVDTKGLNRSVTQGTQIIQFIELVMRNSSYVTDQQTAIIDSVTANSKPSTSTTTNKTTTWFKINVTATPIGTKMDTIRKDYAYDIVYTVTPYAINQAESQYFPQAQFRGVHKVYNYWFTGDNTQVLHYEQEYNTLYQDVISGKTITTGYMRGQNTNLADQVAQPWQNSRVPTTRSGQSDQGAGGGANNPASTLADYLYSQSDQSNITLKIVGDPAWIQQGEVVGLNALNLNFEGFYPDGTINTDVQQAVFAVNWNAPADYNLETGLVDVNKAATGGSNNNLLTTQPQQTAAYTATKVKCFFNQGRFEQEIKGTLLTNLNSKQLNSAAGNPDTARPQSILSNLAAGSRQADLNADGNVTAESQSNPNKWDSEPDTSPVGTDSNPEINNLPTQPALPAQPPTSNGDISDADITYQATLQASINAGDITAEQAQLIGYKPQTMAAKDA